MILISPYSRKLRNGNRNAKDYPYWKELYQMLKQIDKDIVQIGVQGEKRLSADFRRNLPLEEIEELIIKSKFWVSVDNFLPHMAHHYKKIGLVIWGQSDPIIFGYPENINILKDRKYLRENQFDIWENCKYDENVFVKPEVIINELLLLKYEQILKG